jgi:hypothetical protein
VEAVGILVLPVEASGKFVLAFEAAGKLELGITVEGVGFFMPSEGGGRLGEALDIPAVPAVGNPAGRLSNCPRTHSLYNGSSYLAVSRSTLLALLSQRIPQAPRFIPSSGQIQRAAPLHAASRSGNLTSPLFMCTFNNGRKLVLTMLLGPTNFSLFLLVLELSLQSLGRRCTNIPNVLNIKRRLKRCRKARAMSFQAE